jgi:hypothetical protein
LRCVLGTHYLMATKGKVVLMKLVKVLGSAAMVSIAAVATATACVMAFALTLAGACVRFSSTAGTYLCVDLLQPGSHLLKI